MTKIKPKLFELTPEEREMSISMYGKVIKCLIAPYHHIKSIPLEPNDTVYVYPERDLNIQQRKEIVSVMANSQKEEICFVTSDVFIIADMIDGCCRILTPDGEIENSPKKTFAANAHDILLTVLQDDAYVQKHKDDVKDYRNIINEVITATQKGQTITQADYDKYKKIIDAIGEPILAGPLRGMLNDVKVIKEKFKKDDFTGVVEFSDEENEYIKGRDWFKDNLTVKECLKELRDGTKKEEERMKLLEEILDLLGNSRKEDAKKHKEDKNQLEKELKMRHKIEYWLTEQDESKKIKTLLLT